MQELKTMDDLTFKRFFPNFRPREFICPCGECEGGGMQMYFLNALQTMRTKLGYPLKINSGYRCPAYNATLPNSSPNSQHCKGVAADISIATFDGTQIFDLLAYATFTFSGIGIYKTFIHVDMRDDDEVIWIGH